MNDAVLLPLTTRTRVALAIARGIAAAHGHDDLTPGHIALGLIREAENPAAGALQHAGVPVRTIRRELERGLEPRGQPQPHDVCIALTPGERQMLERASAESRLRNNDFLSAEHLLLAILRDGESPAAQAFGRHGFDFDAAVTHLEVVFGRSESGPSSRG